MTDRRLPVKESQRIDNIEEILMDALGHIWESAETHNNPHDWHMVYNHISGMWKVVNCPIIHFFDREQLKADLRFCGQIAIMRIHLIYDQYGNERKPRAIK